MIGLDTNVLVRYLVNDDEEQSARVSKLIDDAIERGEKLFVTQIVLCEVAWVLRSSYGQRRAEITKVLSAILRTAEFDVERVDLAHRALSHFERGPADFSDYLIAEGSVDGGCERIATFDRALLRDPRFVEP